VLHISLSPVHLALPCEACVAVVPCTSHLLAPPSSCRDQAQPPQLEAPPTPARVKFLTLAKALLFNREVLLPPDEVGEPGPCGRGAPGRPCC
jgi:hypothetical protein